jgi:hypothetical protein
VFLTLLRTAFYRLIGYYGFGVESHLPIIFSIRIKRSNVAVNGHKEENYAQKKA